MAVSILVLVEGTLQFYKTLREEGFDIVSILVLVEGTLQLAKILPCLANSHLFCLLFLGLFGTSTLDKLPYKDMLYLNFSILHPPMPI